MAGCALGVGDAACPGSAACGGRGQQKNGRLRWTGCTGPWARFHCRFMHVHALFAAAWCVRMGRGVPEVPDGFLSMWEAGWGGSRGPRTTGTLGATCSRVPRITPWMCSLPLARRGLPTGLPRRGVGRDLPTDRQTDRQQETMHANPPGSCHSSPDCTCA